MWKDLDSYVKYALMIVMKKKKTKDYDILPEDYSEDYYMVWFWQLILNNFM